MLCAAMAAGSAVARLRHHHDQGVGVLQRHRPSWSRSSHPASRPRRPQRSVLSERSGETTRGLQALQKKIDRGDAEFKGLKKTTNQALQLIESVMKKPASVRVGTKWIDIFDAKGRGVRIDALSGKFDTFLSKARVK